MDSRRKDRRDTPPGSSDETGISARFVTLGGFLARSAATGRRSTCRLCKQLILRRRQACDIWVKLGRSCRPCRRSAPAASTADGGETRTPVLRQAIGQKVQRDHWQRAAAWRVLDLWRKIFQVRPAPGPCGCLLDRTGILTALEVSTFVYSVRSRILRSGGSAEWRRGLRKQQDQGSGTASGRADAQVNGERADAIRGVPDLDPGSRHEAPPSFAMQKSTMLADIA